MRDDAMSYGHRPIVSSITLAAMEDLGFYLANYSAAECMSWGLNQGCDYVTSRCSVGRDDRSANTSGRALCEGDPYWPEHPVEIVTRFCVNANEPCSTIAASGYIAYPEQVCNAQCYTGPGAFDACAAQPADAPEAGAEADTLASLSQAYEQWIWLGVLVAGAVLLAAFGRMFCCPPNGSYGIACSLSFILALLGGGLLGVGCYARFYNYDLFSAYVGHSTLYGVMAAGGVIIVVSLAALLGLCRKSGCMLLTVAVVVVILVLVELGITGFIIYWIYSLQDIANDQQQTIQGDGEGRWEGRFASSALAEIENVMCRTYQLCCRDPALDRMGRPGAADLASGIEAASGAAAIVLTGGATCFGHSESLSNDLQSSLQDPSSEKFCPYISGSTSDVEPPSGVCDALDTVVSDFSQSECQSHFCEYGAEGYFEFVTIMVEFIRTYAIAIGGVYTVIVLLQLVWVVNLYNLRKEYQQQRTAGKAMLGAPKLYTPNSMIGV